MPTTMKTRFYLILAAAAVLASCSRQEVEVNEPAGHTYRFELIDSGTKAVLGEEGVFWDPGDLLKGLLPCCFAPRKP